MQFESIDVLADPDAARCVLGYLPQEFGVYPGVGAEALLNHLAILSSVSNKAERRDCIEALLRRTNLWDQRKKAVSGFSGGMRQRFLDLICEVAKQVAVIFSTHLVDDVREPCPNMAILNQGRVLLIGQPGVCAAALEGSIWQRSCEREDIDGFRQGLQVISTKRRAGKITVHVKSESQPTGFEAVQPDLEDIYFTALTDSQQPA